LTKRAATPAAAAGAPERLGLAAAWALFLLVPLLVFPTAKEAFRLPKLLASEWLGLASLAGLAWGLRRVPRVGWRELRALPALVAVAPLVLLALLSRATTDHPLHVARALPSLLVGAACLVGWSAGLAPRHRESLLRALLVPASLVALLGVLQFHGAFNPFGFVAVRGRLEVTSLAGNPGDLGAYLVLPCLIAQVALAERRGAARWAAGAALLVVVYALAVSQTLAALVAAAAGSLVLWGLRFSPRRALLAIVAGAGVAALLVAVVEPLRERVQAKAAQLVAGKWNDLLTGRPDAWAAALWMVCRHPLTGVGFGAYRAEVLPARAALVAGGRELYSEQAQTSFANAHNDYLEVGAELGVPGWLALAWGLWVVVRRALAAPAADRALVWSGLVALALLAAASFPFELALVAYPWLLFLAGVLRPLPIIQP
jgi:O-antigen ligase